MSLRKFAEKVEAELGIFGNLIAAHLGVALQAVQGIDAALKNPIVDGILLVVLPPSISAHIPQATAILDKAITDLMIGTSIEADIKAQTTTEGKLKVFCADLQKYNVFLKHALLQKLLSLVLAGIDNNALKEVMYDTYSQVQYALTKPANQ
jgi:hypothetical protein